MKKNIRLFTVLVTVVFLISSYTMVAQNTSPYWSLSGNSNATSSSKLGTTNNRSLRFYTNNVQRLIINSVEGYLGINTITPNAQLHVNSASGQNPLRAQVSDKTKFLVSSNGGVSIGANETPSANGLYVSGNTGLGTTSPISKLHVVGVSYFTNIVHVAEGGIFAMNTSGNGVYARGTNAGVSGEGIGPSSTGVSGFSENYTGVNGVGGSFGVYGSGTGISSSGVYGRGASRGVYGEATGSSGYGVYGYSTGASGYGIYGFGTLMGMYAQGAEYGAYGYSVNGHGIYGKTLNNNAYAGFFEGSVISTGYYQGSDGTLKQNITDLTSAMDVIKKLHPKSYTFRQDGNYKTMHLPIGKHYGLIAQEVEEVLPDLVKVTTFKPHKEPVAKQEAGAAASPSEPLPSPDISYKALNYTELIPIVVKGMQELDTENKILKQELAGLRQMVMDLQNGKTENNTVTSKSSFLEQNVPNPVAGSTTIRYHVPVTAVSAKVNITSEKGQLIKTIAIGKKGEGQISFNSSTMAAGTYHYSLWVEGKQADTKRLVIVR